MIVFLPQKIGTGGANQVATNKRCHVAPNLLDLNTSRCVYWTESVMIGYSNLLPSRWYPAIMPLSFRPTLQYDLKKHYSAD